MGDDKKKGGMLKKLVLTVILVPALSWIGYFAYAKTTHQEPTCLFTVLYNKCCK
jgi:uncharacterized membrane protein YukC